jgi:hypothetical protein
MPACAYRGVAGQLQAARPVAGTRHCRRCRLVCQAVRGLLCICQCFGCGCWKSKNPSTYIVRHMRKSLRVIGEHDMHTCIMCTQTDTRTHVYANTSAAAGKRSSRTRRELPEIQPGQTRCLLALPGQKPSTRASRPPRKRRQQVRQTRRERHAREPATSIRFEQRRGAR